MNLNIYYPLHWLQFGVVSTWFIVSIVLAFYIPGSVILRKLFSKYLPFEKFVVYVASGLVFWAYQGMIFGYLGLRWMSYLYLLVFFILWNPMRFFRIKWWRLIKVKKLDLVLLFIFVIGMLGQINRFIPTGFVFSKGVYIFTGASDDAFWQAALTNQLVRRFPPEEPGLTGTKVYNYHYWSNLAIAELVRVFRLPLLTTQFVYSYVLLSLLLGGLAYVLARNLNFSRLGTYAAVYLQYFASDIIYLTSFVTSRKFEFRVHPLEDGTMFLENPPRAFSFVVTLLGLVLLFKYAKTKNLRLVILIALVLGSIIGFKVHTGIMVLGAISGLAIYCLMKKDWKSLIACLLTVSIAALIHFPVNSKSGMPVFVPFEMSRMFAVQGKLHLSFLELRRRIHAETFDFLRSWLMDIIMLIIFLISQFGIRNLGWFAIKKTFRILGTPISIFLVSGIIVSTGFGTLFIQPVAGADIFNAYLATSIFLWLFAIILINSWFASRGRVAKLLLILLIAAMTMPRWIYKTSFDPQLISQAKPFISTSELAAMKYVRVATKKDSVVLVFNLGQWDSMYPYVSIFIDRNMFLSGQTILERHGIPHQERIGVVNTILSSKDSLIVAKLLKDNGIDILYFYGNPKLEKGLEKLHLRKIFQNDNNTIYQYDAT